MGKKMKNAITRVSLILVPVVAFFFTIFLAPLWMGLYNLTGLSIVFYSYVWITIGCMAIVAFFFINSKKRPNWKFFCFILALLAFVIALQFMWANWFAASWF